MKHKLSPWHSGDTKPVHVGIYQIKGFNDELTEYSVWENGKWYLANTKQEMAEIFHKHNHVSWIQNKKWRGIVK